MCSHVISNTVVSTMIFQSDLYMELSFMVGVLCLKIKPASICLGRREKGTNISVPAMCQMYIILFNFHRNTMG